MQASTRAFIKRGGAACAAAAVLLGGSFTVATAAPSSDPTIAPTVASVTAEATSSAAPTSAPSATSSTPSSAAPLPDGLAEAVKDDLDLSVEEFNAQGELAAKAAQVQTEVVKADPNAQVSIAGDTIRVQASPAAAAAAKAVAGSAKVSVTSVKAAPLSTKVDAANVDALFADYISAFGAAKLQSIMVNGNGEFVIRTGDPAKGGPAMKSRSFSAAAAPSVSDFAAKYNNVKIEAASGPAAAYATDVTNGQGYAAFDNPRTTGGACSIGWNGFNKAGAPAVITAGHCTGDGALTDAVLTDPEQEPAVTGDLNSGGLMGPLGTFGASQFGGKGNTPATAPTDWDGDKTKLNNIGTDVAVIDGIDPAINQLAKVTDWKTPADPKASGPVVGGISDAIVGTDICKSGRTTGWTCGTVTEVGVFTVAGTTYPDEEAACNPVPTVPACDDIRAVRGFGSTNLDANQGDSGGAIIAGNLAVGMTSAGTPGVISYGVSLTDALKHTGGYTVKIFLEAPKVTTTAPLYREGAVTGTVAGAPAGTTVTVVIDGVTTEAPVGADGKWSTKAPNEFGTFSVTATTKNGFNTSETTEASIEVIKETLAAPAITTPANNSTVGAPVTTISGTGKAGATVELTGGVTGTAVVGADGKWSFTIEPGLEVGPYTVTAKQTLTDWNASTNTTSKFTVVPAAPAIKTPSNGQEFAFDQGPAAISGTNIEGATLSVTLNGKAQTVTVVDGTWSVALDAKLASGKYTVTAVQTVDGVDSLTTTSAFTVLAEPKPEPTTPPVTQEPTTAPTVAPTTEPTTAPTVAPTKAPTDNNLANTGASSSLLVLGGAGGLLLLAGAVFLLIRRRNTTV
ncbi:LPXTG cell wall anchor domain-containing protein [Arthrobacter sp. BF1]|uniref:LPXTG cell wall anchor domain-containing protein n=1 Tax=Arthrobacter sp. BF1 TaxID=2821145 RepID=UPI001C4FCB42|nr:LPXTG cell wall anchor domain-containing protein [Arthrobacter sp. BF1]